MPERTVGPYNIDYTPNPKGAGELRILRDGDVVLLDRVTLASKQRRSAILAEIPEGERDDVGAALVELATASPNGTTGPTAADVLQSDGREIVHPTFELRDRFLLYGFRVERPTGDGNVEEVPVRVVSVDTGAGIELRVPEGDRFELDDVEFVFDPRWRPPDLDERWSRAGLRELLDGGRDAPPPGDVYRRVRSVLVDHIDFVDAGAYPVLAAFTMLTYVARAFPAVPYVGLLGPKDTGKSQTLDTLSRLCLNAYKGRITSAGLGDNTSALRGTVLVDQAGRLHEELVDLLVDGYRRDGGKRRVVDVDNRGSPHEFDTFGPKVLATKDKIDHDLLDRLVVIHTAPAARPVKPLPASEDRFRRLRGDLYASALAYWPLYVEAAVEGQAETIQNRTEELWRPLEAVLAVASAPEDDLAAARELYRRSAVETVAELGDWELAVLDAVGERFRATEADDLEIVNLDLLEDVHERLGIGPGHEGPRPGERWLGNKLDQLNLLDGNERRRHPEYGKRVRIYSFTRARVEGQRQRFGVPSTEVSRPSRPPGKGSGQREDSPRPVSERVSRRPDLSGDASTEGGQGGQSAPTCPSCDGRSPDGGLCETCRAFESGDLFGDSDDSETELPF